MVVIQWTVKTTKHHNLQMNESLLATGKSVISKKGSSRSTINIQKWYVTNPLKSNLDLMIINRLNPSNYFMY